MNILTILVKKCMSFFRRTKLIEKARLDLPQPKKPIGPLTLREVFASNRKYIFIMNLLIQKQKIAPGSHFWKDTFKGSKSTMVSLIKEIGIQGYFIENKRLTNTEIREICYNTFGMLIGIDTIKKYNKNIVVIDFIPLASSI